MMGAANRGFTIIEVMFFLAITGLMAAGLFGATSVTINHQRYSDSIISTQAFLQQQFNEVSNVVNQRSDGQSCGLDAQGNTSVTQQPSGVKTDLGASNTCIILGKAIDLPASGDDTITSYNVVGTEPDASATNNLYSGALYEAYKPGIDTTTSSAFQIPWSASLYHPSGNSAKPNRILLMRDPKGATIALYAYNRADQISSAFATEHTTSTFCVESGDITGAVASLSIQPFSTSEAVTVSFENVTKQGDGSPC